MPKPVPRTIWMLWLQGWDDAPELVRACRASWERRNPGWDVRALDASDIADAPGVAALGDTHPAARSDLARIHLLRTHGGVWADASVFCARPLDDWLPPLTAEGFFAFDAPGRGRLLSSWFLAAAPDSYVVQRWAEASTEYWRERTGPDEYFWFHLLFGDLYTEDPQFRATWDAVPRVPADGPHYFAPYGRRYARPLSRRASARLSAGRDPVYKLRSRPVALDPVPGSAHHHFTGGARTPLAASTGWEATDRVLHGGYVRAKRLVNRARQGRARR